MKFHHTRRATDPPGQARARRRASALRTGPLAGAIVVAMLIAGCGGSGSSGGGVVHVNTSTTAKSSTKPKPKASALAYSQCMRSHGVPDFPDPNSSGGIQVTASIANSPAFQTAANDCKSLSPAGTVSAAQRSRVIAAALKFSQCMQKNGVPNYPDPKTGPGGAIGLNGIDTNSPAFQRADKECGSLSGGPQSGIAGG